MKLIDLLVQELLKRGGWPHDALSITQDDDGSLCVWDTNDPHYDGFSWKHHTGNSLMYFWCGIEAITLSCDHRESIVTRDQYESTLAASQKPTWNGEGVPPVGCECEYLNSNGEWSTVKVKYSSDQLIVISGATKILGEEQETEIAKDIIIDKPQFRPLRTEAESKRDAAVEAMQRAADDGNNWIYSEYEIIYDAIAAEARFPA